MLTYEPLVYEYRGKLLDLIYNGYLSIVDENSRVIYSVGDPNAVVFYRSSSKPIQALSVIKYGLDKKYGLTDEETVIFAGSHTGEPFHVAALESIIKKAGLTEDLLIMKPTSPSYIESNEMRICQGLPPRKFYHNCSGKHIALMLVQRELGGDVRDYWKPESSVQHEVISTIKTISEVDSVEVGIDGCGVPVFATGIKNIAAAFKNLACIDTIKDDSLRNAAASFIPRIHQYPHMMRGTGYLCSLLNNDPNIIAKGGANGIYGFGLKKERLGVSFKLVDGTEHTWPLIVLTILRELGCLSNETAERLETLHPQIIYNDNDLDVGRRIPAFELNL